MNKEKLLAEHDFLKKSLIEKIEFEHSEEYYNLPLEERSRMFLDRTATETHLSSLSRTIWESSLINVFPPSPSGVSPDPMYAFFLASMFAPFLQQKNGSATTIDSEEASQEHSEK